MRKINIQKIWLPLFLLVIFGVGCSDANKSGNDNPSQAAPTVLSAIPPNGTGGACPNTLVTVTFSKAMAASSINSSTFTLTGPGSAPVAGQVTYDASSKTAIFTPSSTLALSTAYSGTVTTGAKDTSGDGLASSLVFSFTTGSTVCQPGPPSVISVGPPDGTVGVCNNTVAVASFGAAMNPATINTTTFTLTRPGAASVAGQVSYDAPSRVAIFTPSAALALSTT